MIDYRVGDVREVMATIADGTVDLIATSPPFLALRSYLPAGHDQKHAEIGSEANPAAYIDMLLNLTAEWGRVLAPHGSIAIELGDTYAGTNPKAALDAVDWNGDGGSSSSYTGRGNKLTGGKGWPANKSLALIPQLYAVALAYGINPLTGNPSPAGRWLVRNIIVWHRPNPAVGALGDKVRPSTSYIVIATRSPKRWFDLTAVRETPKPHSLKYDAARKLSPGTGYVVDTRGDGGRITGDMNTAGAPPLDTWTDEYDGTHDTWTLTTQPSPLAHYAMWPAKLAERLILMMCPREVCRECGEPRRRVEGPAEYPRTDSDLVPARLAMTNGHRLADGANQFHHIDGANTSVTRNAPTLGWTDCGHNDYRPGMTLDPFCGSGTTLAVADLHHRDAIGIDLDPRNRDLYPARYHEVKRALYGTPAPQPGQGVLAL